MMQFFKTEYFLLRRRFLNWFSQKIGSRNLCPICMSELELTTESKAWCPHCGASLVWNDR